MSKAEIFENERATGYNEFVDTWIPNYNYFLDQLPRLLRETSHKDLLVVGCGTGNEIERFTQAPEHWQITGIDPSPHMIQQAREKFKNFTNVTLIEGLLTDLDAGRKFSAATLLLVLHFFPDNEKLKLLKSIAERLVPGAPLVVLDFTGDENQISKNLEVYRLLLPARLTEEQVSNRMKRIRTELYHISENDLAELFVEAGFETPLRFFQTSVYMGWMAKRGR